LKNGAPRRVRARLENGPHPVAAITLTNRLQRVGDCRWMVAKIVNHFYAAHLTTDFLPPGDTGKTLERIIDLRFGTS